MRGIRKWTSAGAPPAVLLGALLSIGSPAHAGEGPVALQTADPSCRDTSGRIYVDCGNGTVTDNRSGLVWLKNAGCIASTIDWQNAVDFAWGLADLAGGNDCGLSDHSSPGEWRLPSKTEWEAMFADAAALGCNPRITNDQGTACWDPTCSSGGTCAFTGIDSGFYWSASTVTTVPSNAWMARLSDGFTPNGPKIDPRRFWAVRGGQ